MKECHPGLRNPEYLLSGPRRKPESYSWLADPYFERSSFGDLSLSLSLSLLPCSGGLHNSCSPQPRLGFTLVPVWQTKIR
jgi:hypothetical protein